MSIIIIVVCICIYMYVNKEETKVEFLSEELDEVFARRFKFAALRIDKKSELWIEEALSKYGDNYFDNEDAVAMLELLEEEACNYGTHPEIRRMFNIFSMQFNMKDQSTQGGRLYVCC